jgi:hypothetical protein
MVSASASPVVSASASPEASATPTPSLLKKVGVKIQFLPPPMEGTISLGIYDHTGKLVRVLHKEATGDEFVAALDGYITHWDRKDDNGDPLPEGHYDAKGYMVGDIGLRATHLPSPSASGSAESPTPTPSSGSNPIDIPMIGPGDPNPGIFFPDGKPFAYEEKIHVGLIGNPLDRDRTGSADVAVGLDSNGAAWLELTDGLPLKKISPTQHLTLYMVGRSAPGQPLIVILATDDGHAEVYAITKIRNMMAFDCGGFAQIKGAEKICANLRTLLHLDEPEAVVVAALGVGAAALQAGDGAAERADAAVIALAMGAVIFVADTLAGAREGEIMAAFFIGEA